MTTCVKISFIISTSRPSEKCLPLLKWSLVMMITFLILVAGTGPVDAAYNCHDLCDEHRASGQSGSFILNCDNAKSKNTCANMCENHCSECTRLERNGTKTEMRCPPNSTSAGGGSVNRYYYDYDSSSYYRNDNNSKPKADLDPVIVLLIYLGAAVLVGILVSIGGCIYCYNRKKRRDRQAQMYGANQNQQPIYQPENMLSTSGFTQYQYPAVYQAQPAYSNNLGIVEGF